ncbi:hypothetical protein PCANC_24448 [Puccinia coronata f. sp. avenae]|uniref:Uncharacterized protein n=1 Tax=Puccinia coronata f. sp. avenae TaxID=200324 RepID=A0A2N5TYT4_9BASI|nr:hypothetical protein PCANC_24448 [Puccinia coronata f. sp. avenae]PLW30659.1 hypothetical protein PCASD_15140 [Puccinia coronata f. sp. avenae]
MGLLRPLQEAHKKLVPVRSEYFSIINRSAHRELDMSPYVTYLRSSWKLRNAGTKWLGEELPAVSWSGRLFPRPASFGSKPQDTRCRLYGCATLADLLLIRT